MQISAADWQTLSHLMDEALDLPESERAAWLDTLGAEHARLKPWLLEMLSADAVGETADLLNTLPKLTSTNADSDRVRALFHEGALIGPYRLMREIGFGGMGAVWLAERSDGALKRSVALKLPLFALANQTLAERFNRERDILAALTHPNIARLYDAGAAASGQPYLALEYVEGEPLTTYCDKRQLPVDARIALFQQVLRAVQHAHANLVLHRDLKPSNILVTAEGEVKLLDFGIAKMLVSNEDAQETELTRAGGRALTLDYASPEQVIGAPISTASDVYSLGVILFELLTGDRPYRIKRDNHAALEEAIAAANIVKASTAAKDSDQPLVCGLEPKRLATLLIGDLDTIIAKALKKNPEHRYATVSALADDLQRYANGEAVLAQPDSGWYRAKKFVRRNKLAVGAGAAVVASLTAGLGAAVWEAAEASKQRDQALQASNRADVRNEFMEFLLSEGSKAGAPISVTQLLGRGEQAVEKQYGSNPVATVELQMSIGALYGSIGEIEKAHSMLERAHASAKQSGTKELQARAACWLARPKAEKGQFAEATQLINEGLSLAAGDDQSGLGTTTCLLNQSGVAILQGNARLANDAAERALMIASSSKAATPNNRLLPLGNLAAARRMAGRYAEADQTYAALEELLKQTGRERTTVAATVYNNWGTLKAYIGDYVNAEKLLRIAVELSATFAEDGTGSYVYAMNYANYAARLAMYDKANQYYAAALAGARKQGDPVSEAYVLLGQGAVLREKGQLEAAASVIAQAEQAANNKLPASHIAHVQIGFHKGLTTLAQTDYEAARRHLETAAAAYAKASSPQSNHVLATTGLSKLSLQQGNNESARQYANQAMTLANKLASGAKHSYWLGIATSALADVQWRDNQRTEARQSYALSAEHLAKTAGADHPLTVAAKRLATTP